MQKAKTSLLTKFVKYSKKEAWELENHNVRSGAEAESIEDAMTLSELWWQRNLYNSYLKDLKDMDGKPKHTLDPENGNLIKEILKKYSLEDSKKDNPALVLFESSFDELSKLVEKHGKHSLLINGTKKEKLLTVLTYYPKYLWLKKMYLKFPDGRIVFEEYTREVKEAFEGKVEGRFSWNIQ